LLENEGAWNLARTRLEGERQQLMTLLHEAQERLAATELLRSNLSQQVETLNEGVRRERQEHLAELQGVQTRLTRTDQQQAQMLVQMHDLQEALEEQILLNERLNGDLIHQKEEASPGERAESIEITGVGDSAPHLHVDLRLQAVRLGARRLGTLDIRLVEHAGNPGLLFWEKPTSTLAAWSKSGVEDGRGFMLLIPGSSEGRTILQRLGSRDWTLVLGLARLLQRALQEEPRGLIRWAVPATRLLRTLEAQPPRLRYDDLRVTGRAEDTLLVQFEGGLFGNLDLGSLRLRWSPRRRLLEWLAPQSIESLALSEWPITAEGRLVSAVELPVGAAGSESERRRRWSHAPAADQALMLAVLDALPGAARAVDPSALGNSMSAGQLTAGAVALHKEARRTIRALRMRALSRRLLMRGEA
jgi:hypothetical protein